MKFRSVLVRLIPVLLLGACFTGEARAHATGENYVWLNVAESHLEGHFEIRLADLRKRLEIDVPEDVEAARLRVMETAPRVQEYLRQNFEIRAGEEIVPWDFVRTELFVQEDLGHFAQYFYRTPDFDVPDLLTVRNEVFHEGDRFHRGLLCIEKNAKTGEEYSGEFTALIFSPAHPVQDLDLNAIESILMPRDFVWQGILHIWIGIDHILFLLTLLLPAVLVLRLKEHPRWTPVASFRAALWNIIKIVTIFTVAHSITLSLAALEIVQLPSAFVESTIAASIILVGVNNMFPRFQSKTWIIIFVFGLFHGLGFASVMGELPFRMGSLVKVILAFNIGVELGQAAIVAVLFPLLFLLRRWQHYSRVILVGGSVVLCFIAARWFLERAFGVTL